MEERQLSLTHKITLYSALAAAILTIIAHILIREWYQPDLRYEIGSYYISGETAVTSLKLKNHGHSDADNIKVNVVFDDIIKDIVLDNKSLAFNIIAGGIGKNFVSGEIARIVQGQELYIYYAINYSDISKNLLKEIVKEITYKGGRAKTGQPYIWIVILQIFVFVVIMIISSIIFKSPSSSSISEENAYSSEFCHPIRCKVATQSGAKLPPNPVQSCHPHRSAATRGRLGITESHSSCQDSDYTCSSVAVINGRRVQGLTRLDLARF